MSASMVPAPGPLSFRRVVDIPFETFLAALDSWQRTGQGGELRSAGSQLDIDRWSTSSTALELIPCGRVRPTAAYFRAGHLLLDWLTCSLPQQLAPAHARDTASQAYLPVGSGRP
jgi:hypothetical protein